MAATGKVSQGRCHILRPRGGGMLDMLTIDVPSNRREAALTRIEFYDTSLSALGSMDPTLDVSGVTMTRRWNPYRRARRISNIG